MIEDMTADSGRTGASAPIGMVDAVTPSEFTAALRRRLEHLSSATTGQMGDHSFEIAQLLADLATISDPKQLRARLWLILTTVMVNYPTTAEFKRIERLVRRGETDQAAGQLLDFALTSSTARLLSDIRLIDDKRVVISEEFAEPFLVPNQTEVILLNSCVTSFDFADRLGCLARFSGSRLTIPHPRFDETEDVRRDTITMTQDFPGLLNSPHAPTTFAALKHAHRVVVEDHRAARELNALFSTLPNQGLPIPEIMRAASSGAQSLTSSGAQSPDLAPQESTPGARSNRGTVTADE